MKKIWTLIALFVGIGFAASAQTEQPTQEKERMRRGKLRHERMEKRSPEEIAKLHTERLDKKLNFSEEQRADIYAYHLDRAKKFSTRAEALKKQREARMQELKSDRQKLKDLLTAEQQDLLAKEMKDSRKKMLRERRGDQDGRRGHRPMMHRKMEKKSSAEDNMES